MNYEAFFKISYGLYIISSKSQDKASGFIGNTVFQVTSDPINFALCSSKNNYTTEIIKESSVFAVSVLNRDINIKTLGLFGYKSGRDVNKFEQVKYVTGETGVPIVVEDTLAYFECRVIKSFELPTHVMFIASVINNNLIDSKGEPLTYSYYRDVIKGKAPENAPTYINKK